jgi:hypothetical protein
MPTRYYPGQGVRVTFEVRNEAEELSNASQVTIMHEDPSGAKTELTPTNPSTGVYTLVYTFVAADVGLNEFECVAESPDTAGKSAVRVYEL